MQIIIAGDYGLCASAEHAGKHSCVIGIAKPHFFDRRGFDSFGDLPESRDDLGGRDVLSLKCGCE